jgi:hypothetical protein
MFSGCIGVGPDGVPIKVHFKWVSKDRVAKRKSKNHEKGAVYQESTTMDAAYFKAELRVIGKKIRAIYKKRRGFEQKRVTLQIDGAGGHGLARGHAVFAELKAMMDKEFRIDLVQQPGNSPMFNILDLTIWQAIQLEVDDLNGEVRQSETALVGTCEKAWHALPEEKVLRAFEMRKDCANEVLESAGECDLEGKGRGGSKRVHNDPAYAGIRKRLKL